MHWIARSVLPLGLLLGLSIAGSLKASDLSTSFEFDVITVDFTVGNAPNTVHFADGAANSIGDLNLYRTGTHSWMVATGETGVITFDTPAKEVELYLRTQTGLVTSLLTLFDEKGGILATFDGGPEDWTEVAFTAPAGSAIGSITVVSEGLTGFTAVDDFSCGLGALEDPLPDPIPVAPRQVHLTPVAEGLTAPNWGTSAPGLPGRILFVTDQSGQLWQIDTETGRKRIFLDVSDLLVELGAFGEGSFDERGLLGLAFDPDYADNGLFYIYTSQPATEEPDFSTMPAGIEPDHQTVITEFTVLAPTDPTSLPDPAGGRELLRIDQPQFNHDGGALGIGPDGYLYISLGDGGNADDEGDGHGESGNGRDPSNVLGTILRIDPTGTDSLNGQYGLPPDNPFLGNGPPFGGEPGCSSDGFCDEIFAYGFRNPFRMSFDQASGLLIAADVGQNDIEEIDLVLSGRDYGWSHKEGSFCFRPNGVGDGFVTDCEPGQVPPDLVDPVAQYDHDEGLAIIGGFVYRGDLVPGLRGRYVFGDFAQTFAVDGRLFALSGDGTIFELLPDDPGGLSRALLGFGQDAHGEIYVLTNTTMTPFGETGQVLRLELAP